MSKNMMAQNGQQSVTVPGVNMKYKGFDDWFDEIENYCLRSERFHDEFAELDYIKRQRMVEWLQAAWYCAREKGDKND